MEEITEQDLKVQLYQQEEHNQPHVQNGCTSSMFSNCEHESVVAF